MNKAILVILVIVAIISNNINKQNNNEFDKQKWLSNSEYRYEISKSNKFPNFKGKSKKYVKEILGEPDEIRDNVYIYCLDIKPAKYYDSELKRKVCKCKASYVLIDFEINDKWKTTFVWVETE